jgi:amino-acid N-acetyltransferase
MVTGPAAYLVEPARAHDLERALELLRRLGLPEKGVVESFRLFQVVRDDGRVIGLAGLEVHGPDGLLRSVAVEPAYQGQGIGAILVDACLVLAGKIGLQAVYLLTSTAPAYFRGLGFADCPRAEAPAGIRESWEFQTGCPSTSAFLKRALADLPRR